MNTSGTTGEAPWWSGALAGLLAAATGVSVATGIAAVLTGVPSPIESVGTRDYDAEAPIKMSSRIDVPRSFQSFKRDEVRVGGVARAQAIGIRRVEVKVDGGPWAEADLGTEDTIEASRQWSWKWDEATKGRHTLTVRATDADGRTQTSDRARIRPNGTTGWHSVQFTVA